jgi:DNA-binding CsgD family transcriptional regulator
MTFEGGVRILERDGELADCVAALDRARGGFGAVVVVEGPAGIGKTELLRAVRAQASGRGVRVLAARGLEVERDLAFAGVRQLLEPVLRTVSPAYRTRLLSGSATPARRLLTGEFTDAEDSDPAFAMLNALYWVLARLAEAEPLVILIDDAHWLDPPSLRMLDFLAPRISELHALVLVATRPPHDGVDDEVLSRLMVDPASRLIRLSPLSPAAVTELLRGQLGEEPDTAFVDACTQVTGGNPFYLAELLRELALTGVRPISAEARVVRTIGPRSISLVLRFRAVSSVDATALARALAVLGDDARLDHAAEVAGLERDAAASAADALTRERVLAPGPELSFAHPIVRTAVYADLGPHERASAHARAARLLHRDGAPIERVAAHLMNTDAAQDAWVVEVLRTAAAFAFAEGAPDTGGRYLRRALAEPPARAVRPRVLLELGRAELSTAQREAPARFAEAYSLATDAPTRADAATAAAFSLFVAGRSGEAVAMLAAASDELTQRDPDRALRLEAELAAIAMNEPAAAGMHLPRLDRVDEELAANSEGARMMLCVLGYRRMLQSQDATRAVELAQRAIASGELLAERGAQALEFAEAALTLICADRVEPAQQVLEAALGQARERGSRQGFAHATFLRSELSYRRGALHDAEADAHASLGITVPSGVQAAAAAATSVLIVVLIERGAVAEACDALGRIGLLDGAVPPQSPYILLQSARGRLRLARGDIAGGLADLHECGRHNMLLRARNPLFVPWRIDAALAHRVRGEYDAAHSLAEQELAAARDWGTSGTIGAAQRVMGLLSSGDEAIGLLQAATAALADSPARLEHARALVDLGAALRRANRRTEARQPLTHGLDLADHCGATILCQRALDELAAMGTRPRRRRLTGVESLTASERRVAQMAAAGRGNVEIAQTLFVTRKTVEKHLSNAYAKLGVQSRTELSPHYFAEQLGAGGNAAATENMPGRANRDP